MEIIAVFAIPLAILAFAFVLHGFPDIHIGTKEIHHHHKSKKDENNN